MTRTLKGLMKEYLERDGGREAPGHRLPGFVKSLPSKAAQLPIKPSKGEWEAVRDPTRLHKTFEFTEYGRYKDFVNEVLMHEADTGHHGKLILNYPRVTIEVNTPVLDSITEEDKHYAATIDEIYNDVLYYGEISDQGYLDEY